MTTRPPTADRGRTGRSEARTDRPQGGRWRARAAGREGGIPYFKRTRRRGKTPIILNGGSATAPKIHPRESHIHICKHSDYKCKHLVYICNFWGGLRTPPLPPTSLCVGLVRGKGAGGKGGGRSPPTQPNNQHCVAGGGSLLPTSKMGKAASPRPAHQRTMWDFFSNELVPRG